MTTLAPVPIAPPGDAAALLAVLAPERPEALPVPAYLATLAPGSQRATRRRLRALAALLAPDARPEPEAVPWHRLTPAHVDALAAALSESYAPSTANATLAALRGVLRSCWALGLLDAEELARLTRGGPGGRAHRARGESLPAGRSLDAGELRALFEAAAADPCPLRGARDAALLALLYGAGLRRSEAVALSLEDASPEAVTVRRGKGGKARRVSLASGAGAAVQAWAEAAELEGGPLLRSVRKGDRLGGAMTGRAVARALARLAAAASVAPFTAHDLRRTYAGDLLEAGADVVHVQRLMGHAGPATTARYDRRPEADRARAARLIRVPYLEPRP